MLRLSIVVPVYNVEKWVGRCLDSLLSQDISENEYEIIVVDDESPDNSIDIVKEYEKKHSNIKIVVQKNKGLSGARNTGLSVANGKYVWFVDSDDFVEENAVGRILCNAEENNLDVLCFGLNLFYENGIKEKYSVIASTNGIMTGSEFICKVQMPPAAWAALYRREFLDENALSFMEGILHEDQEFTPRAYFLAKRIMYEEVYVYNYFQRNGSIMKSKNPKKCSDLLKVADSLNDFAEKYAENDTISYYTLKNKSAFAFSQSLKNFDEQTSVSLSDYKNRQYYPIKINLCMNIKDKFKYFVMNLSLKLYVKLL